MKTEWIKIEERLPALEQLVLCVGTGHTVSMARFTGRFERYTDVVTGDIIMMIYYDQIRVWMPLPEPPKQWVEELHKRSLHYVADPDESNLLDVMAEGVLKEIDKQ